MSEAEYAALAERIRAALAPRRFTEQRMFGGICFMVNGNMAVGTSRRGLLVRVGKEGHAAAVKKAGATPMTMGGKQMAGYVFIDEERTRRDKDLKAWVATALAFVDTLPAKTKKAKARR